MFKYNSKFDTKIKITVILAIFLLLGFTATKIYQPENKNIKLYKQALQDYSNGNYSNSYFLFAKVSFSSPLKPVAIYRQSMCAKVLGDKKSELEQYNQLIRYYPNNLLTNDARYSAGQILIESDPSQAYRYFNKVSKSSDNQDLKVASEYYKSRIKANKIRYANKKVSKYEFKKIEKPFRTYLKRYPDGRLAVGVAKSWRKFNPNLASEDLKLIARAYLLAKDYTKLEELSSSLDSKYYWTFNTSKLYEQNNKLEANKTLLTYIPKNNDKYIDKVDYNRNIDYYIKQFETDKEKYNELSTILKQAKGNNRDYVWHLKCSLSPNSEKYSCYDGLYKTFPKGDYAKDALYNLINILVKERKYAEVNKLTKIYIKQYKNTKEMPQMLFWLAKSTEASGDNSTANDYYNQIITDYPDSYYAYRAFWLTNNLSGATLPITLKEKKILYPYKIPAKKKIISNLIQVKDYDLIAKYEPDKFVKSWIEYEKGNYATSLITARDAMSKLETKPSKSDLRWRLVYPENYYKQVRSQASQTNNSEALIIAILREESSFNPKAYSEVGAMGLMQLMPETAADIAKSNKINFETNYLFNPELNIKLGNLYFTDLKKYMKNDEVLAIASYNGGMGSVDRWKKALSYNDIDEFVAQIPYEETQHYVEKIFGSYWNYTRIYQK